MERHLSTPFWIFVCIFAVRLFSLIRLADSPYFIPEQGDMWFYSSWAMRIVHGQWTDHRAFYGLPGYAFFLAGLFAAAGFAPFLAGLLQCVSEAFIGVIIYKLALAVFSPGVADSTLPSGDLSDRLANVRPHAIGILAAAGWAFFQPAQAFSIIMMPTTWLILAFWGCVLWIINTRTASIWKPWLCLGLLVGLVSMMIATILFLIPLILAAIILQDVRSSKAASGKGLKGQMGGACAGRSSSVARVARVLAATALLFLGIFAGESPCWLHNRFVAHDPVLLSAHSGLNFFIGNNPQATGYPHLPPGMRRASQDGMLKDSITVAEQNAGHKLKLSEVSRFWSRKASAFIQAHPGQWLLLLLTKIRKFWNAYQYDDLSLITLFRDENIILPGPGFGIVAVFGLAGMFLAGFRYPRSRWIIAAVLLHMASLLSVFVTERYRMAAVPGLLLTGSLCLWELWMFLAHTEWAPATATAGAVCVAAAFISWPQNDPGLWSLDFYNNGIKETETGQLDRAQHNLEIAYAYVPVNSEINFALGNLWLAKGNRSQAKRFYSAAISLNPRHGGAFNNLGVMALQEGQTTTAAKLLGKSLAINPEDAKTHYLLAQTLVKLGNLAGARVEIDEALRLRPDQKEFKEFREGLKIHP